MPLKPKISDDLIGFLVRMQTLTYRLILTLSHCSSKGGDTPTLKEQGDRVKRRFGTARPLNGPERKGHPRVVGNCLVYVYKFLTSHSNFKTTSNRQNFRKFHLCFGKNYLSPNIPKNLQKRQKRRNVI